MTTKSAVSFVEHLKANVLDIQRQEARALELEFALDDMCDYMPPQRGIEGEFRRLLNELADTNAHLCIHYKRLAGV